MLAWCLVVVLVVAACSSGDGGKPFGLPSGSKGVARADGPRITTNPVDGARDVAPNTLIEVRISRGRLESVSVANPAGRQIKGALSGDGLSWRSAEPLGYDRRYTVTAKGSGTSGRSDVKAEVKSEFTTLRPDQTVYPSFFPPPGKASTVGVGQPIAVIFDKAPRDRKAAERALRVSATPAQEGGWYWWDDRTLHYRPKTYWKAGTRVTVTAKIYGVKLGAGMYGETDRSLSLKIGPAKIATVDDRTHMMTVTVNGAVVKKFPVSMGRGGEINGAKGKKISLVTPSGTYVAQEKYKVKQMASSTYGLPKNASLGYDAKVPLAVRISNSGIFVHSAPWSVADQGIRNVSHGCVNLSPTNGQWFYTNFSYGDIVTINHTGKQLEPTDGFGDWNIPWTTWLEGSALH
jgi:lipoprotein-anchoring transpeptidase ErfK/SrfK